MSVRILGLDPGLRLTGWGVIDVDGNRLTAVDCGRISPGTGSEMAGRLLEIFQGLADIVTQFQPDECAIEETFVNRNPASTLKLGHARAAAMLAASVSGLKVSEYSPNAVKKAVVGAGHADKKQIGAMVKMLLPGAAPPSADAADALAIAICHAHHRTTNARIAAAGGARP